MVTRKTIKNWRSIREQVIKRDNNSCVRCCYPQKLKLKIGKYIKWESILEVDHILPIKLGGDETDMNNLQTLCMWCHESKNKWDQSLIAKLKRIKNAN